MPWSWMLGCRMMETSSPSLKIAERMIFGEWKPDKALINSLGMRDVCHQESKDNLLNKLRKERIISD